MLSFRGRWTDFDKFWYRRLYHKSVVDGRLSVCDLPILEPFDMFFIKLIMGVLPDVGGTFLIISHIEP